MQIPHQEGYRNVRLVNYLKGCAGSEALPIKPIRDEGLFAHCQGRSAIKKKDPQPRVCLPSRPNLSNVQGVADGWACLSQAWESPSINTHPSPCPRCTPPAWTGDTSVYLFISFNTLLYLLCCQQACEIDQYLIFWEKEWGGIRAAQEIFLHIHSHILSPSSSLVSSHSSISPTSSLSHLLPVTLLTTVSTMLNKKCPLVPIVPLIEKKKG